jgi:hypothetical protein
MSASLHPTVAFGRRTPHAEQDDGPGRGRLAAILAVAGGLLAGGTAFALRPAQTPAAPREIEARIGVQTLRLPAALVRSKGVDDRIDLALRWPDLGPASIPAGADKATVPRLGNVLLVTLVAPERDGPPADRLAGLYARFLDPVVRPGPAGLVERRFRAGTPYETKELLFSPPDGRSFLALCDARPPAGEVLPPLCTMRFERTGMTVQVRFEPGLIEQWDRIESGLAPLLDRWSRPAG